MATGAPAIEMMQISRVYSGVVLSARSSLEADFSALDDDNTQNTTKTVIVKSTFRIRNRPGTDCLLRI